MKLKQYSIVAAGILLVLAGAIYGYVDVAGAPLHQTLDRLGVENVFYIFPGGHGLSGADYGWNYFHKHAADSLSYVGGQFQKVGQGTPNQK